MKYSIMRSGGAIPPWKQDVDIYIVPVSEDPGRYSVLTPASTRRGREFTLLRQTIRFRVYDSCPEAAVTTVKEALASDFRDRANRYASRARTLFTTGAAALVLGCINIFIPDPLPYLDEAFLLFGGGALAALGAYTLRRQVDPFRNCTDGIITNLEEAGVMTDPVLSTVYRAIRSKARPAEGGENAADEIEQESAWLVQHLNIAGLIQSGAADKNEFFKLIRALSRSFRARRFLRPAGRKTRRYRRRIDKLGLDEDAAAVYEELFCRARDLFAEGGQKFP